MVQKGYSLDLALLTLKIRLKCRDWKRTTHSYELGVQKGHRGILQNNKHKHWNSVKIQLFPLPIGKL